MPNDDDDDDDDRALEGFLQPVLITLLLMGQEQQSCGHGAGWEVGSVTSAPGGKSRNLFRSVAAPFFHPEHYYSSSSSCPAPTNG